MVGRVLYGHLGEPLEENPPLNRPVGKAWLEGFLRSTWEIPLEGTLEKTFGEGQFEPPKRGGSSGFWGAVGPLMETFGKSLWGSPLSRQ